MGLFSKLVGAAVAGLGVFAVVKYLKDYTNFKAANEEDLNELKAGTESAKEAAKRTYIAIKKAEDVTEPAGELGKAVAQMANGAGKVLNTVTPNTIEFAKEQKKKYDQDPEAFKNELSKNLKTMGGEAVGAFETLKEQAEEAFTAAKQEADDNKAQESDAVNEGEEKAADASEPDAFKEVVEGQNTGADAFKEVVDGQSAGSDAFKEVVDTPKEV